MKIEYEFQLCLTRNETYFDITNPMTKILHLILRNRGSESFLLDDIHL